jgi:hypothetical protein
MVKSRRRFLVGRAMGLCLLAAGCAALAGLNGCSSSIANRDPVGEAFPSVTGESLEKVETRLPESLAGKPAVLLIGYTQKTQFDIDRWLMGLLQAGIGIGGEDGIDAHLLEVPTIPGLLPTMASGWIDDGMRSGIPREDWAAVVTLYGGSATPVVEMTGNENGRLARVVVLDAGGTVVWFDDEGYSARKAMAVADLVSVMNESGQE